ncbi:MAG TPA: hypothetical protein VH500_16045 [Nitrososphaeraceae archaeon]|jgi:hypothetical protein
METIEMLGWIAIGFVPMLGALEITSRKIRKIKTDTKILRKEIIGGETLIGI